MAVRSETVRLSLDDAGFSTGMAKAAAATALLNHSLDDLDGTRASLAKDTAAASESVTKLGESAKKTTRQTKEWTLEMAVAAERSSRLRSSLREQAKAMLDAEQAAEHSAQAIDTVAGSSRSAGPEIDRLSGRMALMARAAASLGPALGPIGAVGVAGVAALASQLGFASVGALSLVAATQGVGDALKAVDKAALEPTVKNLQAAQEAMAKLGPDAQTFVTRFEALGPVLADMRDSAAAGWFPGLIAALDSLESAAPRVDAVLRAVSEAGGNLVAEGAEALAGDQWRDFFQFIEDEAPAAITAMGHAVGSLTHGFAELWMAFDPINDGVRDWIVDIARSFDTWASGLSRTEGFADFLAYVQANGPRVAEATVAIGNAILQIVEAAAPLGGPVLQAITGIANALAIIADSPLGTPLLGMASAMSTLNLASRSLSGGLGLVAGRLGAVGAAAGRAQGPVSALGSKAGGFLAVAAGVTALGNALADVTGAKLEMGDLQRNLEGIAQGRSSEALTRIADDLAIVNDRIPVAGQLSEGINEAVTAFGLFGNTGLDNAQQNLESVDQALAQLVESGNAEKAQQILENIAAAQLGALPGSSISPAYMRDLGQSFDAYTTALANAGGETEGVAKSTDYWANTLANAKREGKIFSAHLAEIRTAARESASAFLDFSDAIAGDTFSFDKWIDAFEKQVTALANWRDNLQALRRQGLAKGVLDELIKQGPAAAQAVAGLAKEGKPAIDRLNGVFRRARGELRGVGKDAADAERNVGKLGKAKAGPIADLRDQAFQSKRRQVEGDLNRLDKMSASPSVRVEDHATGIIGAIRAGLSTLHDKTIRVTTINSRATGGAVFGPGTETSDSIPALLSNNEHVLSAAEVRGLGGHGEVERLRALARAGQVPQFATGGPVLRFAEGGSPSRRLPGIGFAELPGINLTAASLKRLNHALALSEKALSKERDEREAVLDKMRSLRSDVAGNLRSDLFDRTVNPWSAGSLGGSIDDIQSVLRRDIKTGRAFSADIAALKRKGLKGSALADLLANATPEQVAMFADQSTAEVREYQRLYRVRASVTSQAGSAAGVAAYGKELAQQTREVRKVGNYVREVRQEIRAQERENRKHSKRGAGNGSRNRRRG